MEVTAAERAMVRRIEELRYTGGGFRRASWIDMVCRNETDRALLADLCRKGLAETGLGGTVAGDPYDACWLTEAGKALFEG